MKALPFQGEIRTNTILLGPNCIYHSDNGVASVPSRKCSRLRGLHGATAHNSIKHRGYRIQQRSRSAPLSTVNNLSIMNVEKMWHVREDKHCSGTICQAPFLSGLEQTESLLALPLTQKLDVCQLLEMYIVSACTTNATNACARSEVKYCSTLDGRPLTWLLCFFIIRIMYMF